MKRFSLIAAMVGAFFSLASCQIEQIGSTVGEGRRIAVTADIVNRDATRVEYTVADARITPEWSIGDEIFGFDNLGTQFTFTVTDVDSETGMATFNTGVYIAESGATKLYAVYAPGSGVDNISDGKISIDLSSGQSGQLDDQSPVVMCATASVQSDGDIDKVCFDFENQVAIIGFKQLKVDALDSICSFSVIGASAKGTFEVVEGSLALSSDAQADTIVVKPESLEADSDGIAGTAEKPAILVAAFPSSSADISVATVAKGSKLFTKSLGEKEVARGQYYYLSTALDPHNLVSIDGVEYQSIDEALSILNDATSETTVKFIEDVTLMAPFTVTNTAVAVTVDLNGHVITSPSSSNRINVTGTSEGGSILNMISSVDGGIYIHGGSSNAIVIKNGSTFNIKDGAVLVNETTSAAIYSGQSNPCVTVDGGTVINNGGANAVSINQTGGTFSSKGESYVYGKVITKKSGIESGYFSEEVSPAVGYELVTVEGVVKNVLGQDYSFGYKVQESAVVVAQIGSDTYSSLEKAVEDANNATEDVKIEMLSDYTMVAAANVANANGKQITIDLAGQTLTCAGSLRLNVTGGVVNLASSLAGGLIDHTGDSNAIVIKGEGTLNIGENVTVLNESASAGIYSGETNTTLNVNGGTVISKDASKNAVSMGKDGASISVAGDSYIYGGISVTTTNLTGGYYTATFKAADGYGFTEVSGVTKTVLGQDYSFGYKIEYGVGKTVAKIGAQTYTSVESAVAAANAAEDNVTIQLESDYSIAEATAVKNVNGNKITIDLAGHTLTFPGTKRLSFAGKVDVTSTGSRGYIHGTTTTSNVFVLGEANTEVNLSNTVIYHPNATKVTILCSYTGCTLNMVNSGVIHNTTESFAVSFTKSDSYVNVSGESYLYGPLKASSDANFKISAGSYLNATTTYLADGVTVTTLSTPVTLSVGEETFSFDYKVE